MLTAVSLWVPQESVIWSHLFIMFINDVDDEIVSKISKRVGLYMKLMQEYGYRGRYGHSERRIKKTV